MSTYDFENEYRPIRDAEQAGFKQEWTIRNSAKHGRQVILRICSATHDDDVELELTGNFTDAQRDRVAQEICDQLNKAEDAAAKEFLEI